MISNILHYNVKNNASIRHKIQKKNWNELKKILFIAVKTLEARIKNSFTKISTTAAFTRLIAVSPQENTYNSANASLWKSENDLFLKYISYYFCNFCNSTTVHNANYY